MKKNSFILYKDNFEAIQLLSMEQRGQLLTAIYHFVTTGDVMEVEPMVKILFTTIKIHLQKDKDKWDNEIEKRKDAGRLGGINSGKARRSKCFKNEASASKTKQNEANEADSVIVIVSVIEDINTVFDAYRSINPNAILTPKGKSKIEARLKGVGKDVCLKAISCFKGNKWRMEHNSDKTVAWFFDSDEKVAEWCGLKQDIITNTGKISLGGL